MNLDYGFRTPCRHVVREGGRQVFRKRPDAGMFHAIKAFDRPFHWSRITPRANLKQYENKTGGVIPCQCNNQADSGCPSQSVPY